MGFQKALDLQKLVKTLLAKRDADAVEEPDDKADQRLSMDDAIRFIQVNERGQQGKQQARFMKEIRKQEELDRKLREMGQPERDPDNAAVAQSGIIARGSPGDDVMCNEPFYQPLRPSAKSWSYLSGSPVGIANRALGARSRARLAIPMFS